MADVDRRRSIRARNDHDETVRIDGASRYPVRSPLWWVNRLYNRLIDRSATMNVYDDYYRGEFPLPWLAPQAEEEVLADDDVKLVAGAAITSERR